MDLNELREKVKEVSAVERKIAAPKRTLRRSPLAGKIILKGENLSKFEDLRGRVIRETNPATKIEEILVEKIIFSQWKLERAAEVERNMLNEQNAITGEERHNASDSFGYIGPPPRKRIRNIKRIRLHSPDIQQVMSYQVELQKIVLKSLERLRQEQQIREQRSTKKNEG